MSEYDWDHKIEYLRSTRGLYYNDDYLEFLVKTVWKISKPVNIIDYGFGYGYLGLKLLPLLPKGSTYTGIDRGKELIKEAMEVFSNQPYSTEFIVGDIEETNIELKYDIAMCHAVLLHMRDPKSVLQKMIDSVVDDGMVICFEPHWIANMSNYHFDGIEQSKVIQLGVVECRVSDKVNFLDPNLDVDSKESLYLKLKEEGIGEKPGNSEEVIRHLMNRGLTRDEAWDQYDAELLFSNEFGMASSLTYAPNMKITFGIIKR